MSFPETLFLTCLFGNIWRREVEVSILLNSLVYVYFLESGMVVDTDMFNFISS